MDRGTAVLLTSFGGALIALQAPINGQLGQRLGTFQASFVSFAIGTAVLLVLATLAKGGLGQVAGVRSAPLYMLTGGLLGAVYVTSVLVTVRTLGAGGVTAATIAAQLAASVAVDHYGWLGVERSPVTVTKVVGIAVLAFGVWLVVRD